MWSVTDVPSGRALPRTWYSYGGIKRSDDRRRLDLFDLREAEAIADRFDEVEARDVHLPGDDALDAPHPRMIVEAGG
jgi:hypothetical protein